MHRGRVVQGAAEKINEDQKIPGSPPGLGIIKKKMNGYSKGQSQKKIGTVVVAT